MTYEKRAERRVSKCFERQKVVNTTPSANIASCDTVAASQTPAAAFIICQKPSSAEAAPAFSPNGESAWAVPSGLTSPC
ncbi:hypothetical protein [Bradyrhizobium sp. AZCC 1610]|uniref:hypothetical protein n=1 Tax=Bradyrhizobium sp. AZCC 1610 TaxID=3117020 RepID=UPI002FF2FF9D